MNPKKPPRSGPPPTSNQRRWIFRLVVPAGVLIFGFALLEGLLRVGGYGQPTDFFLRRASEAGPEYIDNPRFAFRFFPPRLARSPQPLRLSVRKPPSTVRIVVLGESAAMGDPEPAFGMPRQLEVLLTARFPARRFQVINTAMTAINSHALREIARDCVKLDADVWIIYAGNNEVVGPFGAGGGGEYPGLIRARLTLERTRTGQWLANIARSIRQRESSSQSEWAGLETFLNQQVPRDDPRLHGIYKNARENLAQIIDEGRRAGVQVIVSTPVANLRDSAPFASAGPNLEAELAEAVSLLTTRGPKAAVPKLEELTRAHPRHAGVHYFLGRVQLLAGKTQVGAATLATARDLDTLRFRPDRRLTEIIAELGRTRAHRFTDATTAMAAAAPDGVPGAEFFWEHVHFNFPGTYRLARLLAEEVEAVLPTAAKLDGASSWLSPDEVAGALAYTDWSRVALIETVRERVARPPFNTQANAAEREADLTAQLTQARADLKERGLQPSINANETALAKRPDDWVLHAQLARLLESNGDSTGAMKEWREVVARMPHHLMAHFHLGRLLAGARDTALEAETQLRAALDLRDDFPEAWEALGRALGQQQRQAEADAAFARALELRPEFTSAKVNRARAHAAAGHTNTAIAALKDATLSDTNSALAWQVLGRLLVDSGRPAEAAAAWERLVVLRPRDSQVCYQLADAWSRSSHSENAMRYCLETLKLNPGHPEARSLLAGELMRLGQYEKAAEQFRELIKRDSGQAISHYQLGVALMKLNRPVEARFALEKALALDPGNSAARTELKAAETLISEAR